LIIVILYIIMGEIIRADKELEILAQEITGLFKSGEFDMASKLIECYDSGD